MMGTSNPRPTNSGACPNCHAPLLQPNLQIAVELSDGEATLAECPDCRQVITPD